VASVENFECSGGHEYRREWRGDLREKAHMVAVYAAQPDERAVLEVANGNDPYGVVVEFRVTVRPGR
jgi:hypothetical protein